LTNITLKTPSDSNGDVEFYETVGIHQKLKHKFIDLYLKIWVENVGQKSKSTPPSVDFFDLSPVREIRGGTGRPRYLWRG